MNKEPQILDPSKLQVSAGLSTSVKVRASKPMSSEKSAVVTIHTEVNVRAHFGIAMHHNKSFRTFEVKEATPIRTIPDIVTGVKPLLTHICNGVANDFMNRSKAKIKVKENKQ